MKTNYTPFFYTLSNTYKDSINMKKVSVIKPYMKVDCINICWNIMNEYNNKYP